MELSSLMYIKKFTSFRQVLTEMHTKEKWFLFSASRCIYEQLEKVTQFDGLSRLPVAWLLCLSHDPNVCNSCIVECLEVSR